MVVIGLKPSLLIDTIAVQNYLPQFLNFLEELRNKEQINSSASVIRIVSVKDDYFLINVNESITKVAKKRNFIDVSSNLKLPTILNNSGVRILPCMMCTSCIP